MLKIVQQSVELPAAPAALYSMYLDPVRHAQPARAKGGENPKHKKTQSAQ